MNSLGKNFVFTSFGESHGKAIGGVLDGVTLGTPIAFIIRNKDARSEDYEWLKHTYRLGHANRTYQEKYGIRDHRGGGRASARETALRVVAGSVAQQLLKEKGVDIKAKGKSIGRHDACIAVRAAAVVEAMTALVLQDFLSK